MTYRGQHRKRPLPPCSRCGLYSGERKQKEDAERYLVICASCGWHTKFYNSKSAATKAWTEAGSHE